MDQTIFKFMVCGDPRLGVARFECEDCDTRLYVPFSCKRRLFCPSCHAKFSELWVEHSMSEVIRPEVPHRFWTFSIPKRLRPYFRQRKRLTWMVQAAKETIYLAMGLGKARDFEKPGIITLIQTHGDELNWNCHLHALSTDGVFDYSNPQDVKFHPFFFWDSDRIRRTLSYAFRLAVSLKQLCYDLKTGQVTYQSKKGKTLSFKPKDFIATLTQHIPDRYQNMRRYAGFKEPPFKRTQLFKEPTTKNSPPIPSKSPYAPKIKFINLIKFLFLV